jgi:16S rRNA (guanine966-N2)-methyltransferase
LRIIGGNARGRKILAPPPKGRGVAEIRPTAARAREALFNIIGAETEKAEVLDLFAGTGALGLEALSRGAQSAFFVDSNLDAVRIIGRNIELCGFIDRAVVLRRDLSRVHFLETLAPAAGFTLVFIDPPYNYSQQAAIFSALNEGNLVAADGLVVYESAATNKLPEVSGRLQLEDIRHYGAAGFWLYRCRAS